MDVTSLADLAEEQIAAAHAASAGRHADTLHGEHASPGPRA